MDTPVQDTETAPVATNTGTAKQTVIALLLALVIGSPFALLAGATVAIASDFKTFKFAVGISPSIVKGVVK